MKKALLILFAIFIYANQISAFDVSQPKLCDVLNTKNDDFAPVWNPYENVLYFNSISKGFSRFYIAEYSNGIFSKPNEYLAKLNKSRNNQSYISFISENEAILSDYRMSNSRSYINLHRTHKEKNRFVQAYAIDELECDNFSGHSTITDDGKTMVFASNCYSSEDDTDLLITYIDNSGNWSDPIPLQELNTPGNEITPYFVSYDTLLFASNGMQGPGGFDIYMSAKISGQWQTPRPVTAVNTQFDESDPAIINDELFLFASNRSGGKGGLDIYCCELNREPQEIESTGEELDLEVKTFTLSITKNRYIETIPVAYYPFQYRKLDTNYLLDKEIIKNDINFRKILAKGLSVGSVTDTLGLMKSNIEYSKLNLITKDSIVLKPSMLDIKLNAGPKEAIKNWKCYFEFGSANTRFKIAEGVLMPFHKLFPYSYLAENTDFEDSIKVVLSAYNLKEQEFEETFKMTISTSLTSGYNVTKTKNKKYYTFIFPKVKPEVITSGVYDSIFEEIGQFNSVAKSISVEYLDYSGKSSVEAIKKKIKNINKRIPIKSRKSSYRNNKIYSKALSEYLVIIKIELK